MRKKLAEEKDCNSFTIMKIEVTTAKKKQNENTLSHNHFPFPSPPLLFPLHLSIP